MIILGTVLSLIIVILVLVLAYSFLIGIIYGAPYLPTMQSQRQTALELLDLKPGQTVYDLGCGDGRMLRTAAQKGLNAVGYELSPLFFIIAKIINWKYRKQVKIRLGNFWSADLKDADGIYVFLLTKYMPRFDKLIKANARKGVKVASYTFTVPGKKPAAVQNAVYLYQY